MWALISLDIFWVPCIFVIVSGSGSWESCIYHVDQVSKSCIIVLPCSHSFLDITASISTATFNKWHMWTSLVRSRSGGLRLHSDSEIVAAFLFKSCRSKVHKKTHTHCEAYTYPLTGTTVCSTIRDKNRVFKKNKNKKNIKTNKTRHFPVTLLPLSLRHFRPQQSYLSEHRGWFSLGKRQRDWNIHHMIDNKGFHSTYRLLQKKAVLFLSHPSSVWQGCRPTGLIWVSGSVSHLLPCSHLRFIYQGEALKQYLDDWLLCQVIMALSTLLMHIAAGSWWI